MRCLSSHEIPRNHFKQTFTKLLCSLWKMNYSAKFHLRPKTFSRISSYFIWETKQHWHSSSPLTPICRSWENKENRWAVAGSGKVTLTSIIITFILIYVGKNFVRSGYIHLHHFFYLCSPNCKYLQLFSFIKPEMLRQFRTFHLPGHKIL